MAALDETMGELTVDVPSVGQALAAVSTIAAVGTLFSAGIGAGVGYVAARALGYRGRTGAVLGGVVAGGVSLAKGAVAVGMTGATYATVSELAGGG